MTGQSSAALHRHKPGLQLPSRRLSLLWTSHFEREKEVFSSASKLWQTILSLVSWNMLLILQSLTQRNEWDIKHSFICVSEQHIKSLLCSPQHQLISRLLVSNATSSDSCLNGAHLSLCADKTWAELMNEYTPSGVRENTCSQQLTS